MLNNYANTLVSLFLLACSVAYIYLVFYLDFINCQCSSMWYRTYIQYFLFAIFSISLLDDNLLSHKQLGGLRKYLGLALLTGLMMYVYAGYQFINKLEEEKCECAVKKHPYLFMMAKLYNWLAVLSVFVIPVALFVIVSLMTFKF